MFTAFTRVPHSIFRRIGALCLLVLLATHAPTAWAVVIDFESFVPGHILTSGDWPAGTVLSVDNVTPGHPDEVIVFDTNCTIGTCSGEDDDLRTPGTGPGNLAPQFNIMIIAEDVVDTTPPDGIVDDPDDEAFGGVITLTFTVPYKFKQIRAIIDFEEPSFIEIDPIGGGPTQIYTIPTLGENSASTIGIPDPDPASEMRIIFGGSGGLDEIELVLACGDGIVDAGEQCDDGAGNSDTTPDACRTDCAFPVCGDDVVDSGEQCDPPDGSTCDQTCNSIPNDCGDGIVDPGEDCDDGAGNSDTMPDACRTDCTSPACGDGVVDSGEACDEGAGNSDVMPDACRTDCTEPGCGDDVVDAGEQCDDGNLTNGDGCQGNCQLPSCGDGVLDVGEECDDGAGNSDIAADACRTDCANPTCGDNVTDSGEQCDPPDGLLCDASCMSQLCGNGVLDMGEQCDPPDGINCSTSCQLLNCGDGNPDPFEECDPPDGITCDAGCQFRCGNGDLDSGEECDPADGEVCDNFIDDDGDGWIDCHDPDCAEAVLPTCSETCASVGICKPLKRDPATIKLKDDGWDRFKLHARVDANPGDFDPNVVGFCLALYNDGGQIYAGCVPPGSFTERGLKDGFYRRYKFKDKSARSLGQESFADGIYRSNMRFRTVCGEPSYTVKIQIWGDFSGATTAYMTTQYYAVDDLGSQSVEWTRKPANEAKPLKGWTVKLPGGACGP